MKRHAVTYALTFAVTGLLVAARPAFAESSIQGTVSHHKGNANLVVYVETAHGKFHPPKNHPVMDQKKMRFLPHVMPVLLGTTVDFLNSDSVKHNVFSPDGEGYNLGTWAKGERRSYTFKHLGTYTQLCSIHPEMEGFIIVLQNPYFAVTTANGQFTIPDVPPGHYELKVWGEHLKSKEKKRKFAVDVAAGVTKTTIAF